MMKRPRIRLIATAVSVAVLTATGLSSAGAFTAASAMPSPDSSIQSIQAPVTGTTAHGGTFRGMFTPTEFLNTTSGPMAAGRLVGTLTRSNGSTSHVDQEAQLPITAAAFDGTPQGTTEGLKLDAARGTGTCRILNLVLGPLDLNLLGLVVHLNRVHLTITAQTGPGMLLGNLLCAIAHLLDGVPMSGLLAKLVAVLNRILAGLGG